MNCVCCSANQHCTLYTAFGIISIRYNLWMQYSLMMAFTLSCHLLQLNSYIILIRASEIIFEIKNKWLITLRAYWDRIILLKARYASSYH